MQMAFYPFSENSEICFYRLSDLVEWSETCFSILNDFIDALLQLNLEFVKVF